MVRPADPQKNQKTRHKLLKIGKDLLSRKGYHSTGLKEVLDTAGVPKGSFYHHFKAKEDFVLEILAHFSDKNRVRIEAIFTDQEHSPLARLDNFFEHTIRLYRALGFTRGCMAGNLSQELGDHNENFRLTLRDILRDWEGLIAECLQEARDLGDIAATPTPENLAAFIINSMEGALLRMKVEKSASPLVICREMILTNLLGYRTQS